MIYRTQILKVIYSKSFDINDTLCGTFFLSKYLSLFTIENFIIDLAFLYKKERT